MQHVDNTEREREGGTVLKNKDNRTACFISNIFTKFAEIFKNMKGVS